MRIGLFTDTYIPDINGVVSSVVTLQKELERNGHDVFVITNHKALTSKREGNVLRLPGLELKWLYGYKLSTPFHFNAKEEIRKMKLDIIHVHTEFGVGVFGRIVAKHLNIPAISTYHTMYEDYTHYINRFDIDEVEKVGKKIVSTFSRSLSDTVQAVIAPSEKTKEALLKYGVQTPIYIIPTGLDLDAFHPDNIDASKVSGIREKYTIRDDDALITYVGRIAQEKSIDVPIEGFRHIKNKHIKFMIVGGGPQLKELKDLVARYELCDQVFFTDKVVADEVPAYYACADCFVSASLTETQGMTFIEALACGLPVFARPDEVLTDLVIENESGFLFSTPQEFAQKLEHFIALSKQEQQDFHSRARSKIHKYDSRVFYSKVISVYHQAIDAFLDAYEVVKIRMLDDYVKISVMNEKEDEAKKVLIDLDDYFTYKIRIHTMLDRHTVAGFITKEKYLNAYRSALRRLRMRDYTRKEMLLYLTRNANIEQEEMEHLLLELEEKGYINDDMYLVDKIEKLQYSLMGKGKIRRTLLQKGLSSEAVDQALEKLNDEEERAKALKMAEKIKMTLKDMSRKMKQQTMIAKLISLGFDSDIARVTSETIKFEEEGDLEALDKTIQKAQRVYSRKWSGKALRDHICTYCVRKGFTMHDIQTKLDEMEWLENDETK